MEIIYTYFLKEYKPEICLFYYMNTNIITNSLNHKTAFTFLSIIYKLCIDSKYHYILTFISLPLL